MVGQQMRGQGLIEQLTHKYKDLQVCVDDILKAVNMLNDSFRSGRKLLVCGNGGSASDSEHIVGELMKGFMSKRQLPADEVQKFTEQFGDEGASLARDLQGALPAISLVSHTSLMTAFINDVNPHMVFAQQVYGYGKPGDVLIAISTSGNSKNVVNAVKVAKVKGVKTIGLTGGDGGALKRLCDVTICVPFKETPDIQERHLPIYHVLCRMVEEEFFGK